MDYYSTLGVAKTATPDEIKKAYRKLASQHHPDKGGDTKKFQEIEEAYRTLSDSEKRAQYDNPQPQFGGFGGGMPPGFEDIFAQAFGGGNHPFGDIFGRRQQPQRNRTMNLNATISLNDAFSGKEILATIKLPSGREQVIEIKIPPGVSDGTVLRLAGMGDDSFPNMPRGDIHLNVVITDHPIFARQGDDLIRNIEITCVEAMLGKVVEVETLDGKTLEVKINPGTQPGQMMSAQGYGMPNMRDSRFKGRLLMNIIVTVPKFLTDEQKQALEKVFI
jgi:curved DNA-binding protein